MCRARTTSTHSNKVYLRWVNLIADTRLAFRHSLGAIKVTTETGTISWRFPRLPYRSVKLSRVAWPPGEMASRLTTIVRNQEIAGSTPAVVILWEDLKYPSAFSFLSHLFASVRFSRYFVYWLLWAMYKWSSTRACGDIRLWTKWFREFWNVMTNRLWP